MKDIKWFVNRLKAMNILEVAWRVNQKLLQKNEYRKFFTTHLPVTEISLGKDLENLKPDVEKLGINWDNQDFKLFEELNIFGVFDYHTYKKKWNAGFQTKNVWPISDFSYEISISEREDIGDIRTNWELNRHFQFVGLAKNYYITGEEKYINELKVLFEDWNQNNLFLHGVQWISAMEVAIRVISWTYMYAFVKKASQDNNKEFLKKTLNGIKVMADYILRHRARYSSANNHLIIEMLGVGVAGILFGYKKWINIAIKVLTEELPKQNSIDGVNKEMSIHYQSFVMEAYGIMWNLMNKNSITIPNVWKKYLRCMCEFVADCCGDYGEVVVFGDSDEGKILDFYGNIENYYHYVLQLLGMLLNIRYTDTKLNENICWIFDKETIKNYQSNNKYKTSLVQVYKEGGYTILRSKDHSVLIGFDHAELGFGSIAAHGHADALSIQIFYEGNPILVDSGTYNYHVPKKIRNEIRRTTAHNTVYIEGIEQAEMLGPFLWGKRYKILPIEIEKDEEVVIIKGTIKYANVKHTRSLEFNYNRGILIDDMLTCDVVGYQCWNIGNDLEYEFADRGIIGKKFSIISNNQKVISHNVYFSKEYNNVQNIKQILIKIKGYEIRTIISLF